MTVGDSAKAKLVWEYKDGSRHELDLDMIKVTRDDRKGRYTGEFCSKRGIRTFLKAMNDGVTK